MRAVIQRSLSAQVTAEGRVTGKIDRGLVVLLGVGKGDTAAEAALLAAKIAALRIFEDESGKMNRSLAQTGGGVLVVSNFTLYAACRRGNRPDFTAAAGFEQARELYEAFLEALRGEGAPVQAGVFGADMRLALTNDGPVTLVMDTDDLR